MAGERVLDPAALDRLIEWGGEELRDQMVELFIENAPGRVRAVRDGLALGDREGAHRAAHSLKSTSANVGAEALGALAGRIESLLETGNDPGGDEAGAADEVAVRELLPDLESTMRDTVEALSAARDESGGS